MKLSLLFEALDIDVSTDPDELEETDELEKLKEKTKIGARYTQPRNAEAV